MWGRGGGGGTGMRSIHQQNTVTAHDVFISASLKGQKRGSTEGVLGGGGGGGYSDPCRS